MYSYTHLFALMPIMGFEMKIDLGAALGESEFVKKSQTWPSRKVDVHNEN